MPLLITTSKTESKWAAVEGDQNASITKQLVRKQSGQLLKTVTKMLASQHIQKKTTTERATKSKNNTRTTALKRSVEKKILGGGGGGADVEGGGIFLYFYYCAFVAVVFVRP